MNEYQILVKGVFESKTKFERRLNDTCQKGWKAISIAVDHGQLTVLLERNDKNY